MKIHPPLSPVNRVLDVRPARNGKFEGFGRCIYCRRSPSAGERLTEEHIIPEGLGAHWAIREASCSACADETHAFEGRVLGNLMMIPRLKEGVRLKKRRPRTVKIIVIEDDNRVVEEVESNRYPMIVAPQFLPARILSNPPLSYTFFH